MWCSDLALHAKSNMIIFTSGILFFYRMIKGPCLLAFLQESIFLVLILHEVGLFCSNNELAALKNRNPDLDFPNEMHLTFRENPLHHDLVWNLIRLIVSHCML